MSTAILIDGAFFIKRFRSIEPDNSFNASRFVEIAYRCALTHLKKRKFESTNRELYRIFFYDCPPLEKRLHNPITGKSIDFSKSKEAIFRKEVHNLLKERRKVALRLGQLSNDSPWTIKPAIIQRILKEKNLKFEDLTEDDVMPNVRQKGVDMRIGVDIASLVLKKQVDQIILIAGDADFVPAAKLARREGVDFILDPLWQPVPDSLREHIDGLYSTFSKKIKMKKDEAEE